MSYERRLAGADGLPMRADVSELEAAAGYEIAKTKKERKKIRKGELFLVTLRLLVS